MRGDCDEMLNTKCLMKTPSKRLEQATRECIWYVPCVKVDKFGWVSKFAAACHLARSVGCQALWEIPCAADVMTA